VIAVIATACVDPLTTQAMNTPEWDVKNVKGYAETVAGLPPEVVLARDLCIAGGVARWRQCTAIDVCDESEHERPAKDVLAIERVGGLADEDGGGELVKLSLAPRAKYVVPIPVYVRASRAP
jgi:hypothetical protein